MDINHNNNPVAHLLGFLTVAFYSIEAAQFETILNLVSEAVDQGVEATFWGETIVLQGPATRVAIEVDGEITDTKTDRTIKSATEARRLLGIVG